MFEIHSAIDRKVKEFLGVENLLVSNLLKDIVSEYASIWDHISELSKIREIMELVITLILKENSDLVGLTSDEKDRLKADFRELLTNPDALLKRSQKLQIKEIAGMKAEKWISKFKKDMNEILILLDKIKDFIYFDQSLMELTKKYPIKEILLNVAYSYFSRTDYKIRDGSSFFGGSVAFNTEAETIFGKIVRLSVLQGRWVGYYCGWDKTYLDYFLHHPEIWGRNLERGISNSLKHELIRLEILNDKVYIVPNENFIKEVKTISGFHESAKNSPKYKFKKRKNRLIEFLKGLIKR